MLFFLSYFQWLSVGLVEFVSLFPLVSGKKNKYGTRTQGWKDAAYGQSSVRAVSVRASNIIPKWSSASCLGRG